MTSLRYDKTWRLRRAITQNKKALAECRRTNYKGLGRMLAEGLERDLVLIRAELARRRDAERGGPPRGGPR